ncbi:MAG: sugar ABC transporter permease [Bacilli bacterium]|jgi:multiple sugar transport system permease protein|nr:sugar ABC transporter permease [Bacilli bacterium]MCI2054851.1 sugar ABC transporter permease [Bacilli bacterium]
MERSLRQKTKKKHISYSKWGYIFLIPFFVAFILFQLIPLAETFWYSFTKYYDDMLTTVGPSWCGFENYSWLFGTKTIRPLSFFGISMGNVEMNDLCCYALNTLIIWLIGFIPQIIVSLLLAIWFTDIRLNIRLQGFWKTVIYMPNLIMAAALGMLFFMIFARSGPIMNTLVSWGWLSEGYDVLTSSTWTRIIIAFMNFLMWFGNTTLLLMAGVMGIDGSVYESAMLDGASSGVIFRKITMPLLRPIFIYVVITSMIGGIQLFDIPQIFTQGSGGVNSSSYTLMMYLYNLIRVKQNYGQAGALSVLMFLVTAALSMTVYKITNPKLNPEREMLKAQKKRFKEYKDSEATIEEMKNSVSLGGK